LAHCGLTLIKVGPRLNVLRYVHTSVVCAHVNHLHLTVWPCTVWPSYVASSGFHAKLFFPFVLFMFILHILFFSLSWWSWLCIVLPFMLHRKDQKGHKYVTLTKKFLALIFYFKWMPHLAPFPFSVFLFMSIVCYGYHGYVGAPHCNVSCCTRKNKDVTRSVAPHKFFKSFLDFVFCFN